MRLTHAGRSGEWAARLVVAAPELVVTAVAGFTVAPMLLLLSNNFNLALATVLGLAGAVVALVVHGMPAEQPVTSEVIFGALAILFLVGWTIANLHYGSQDVYAIRDPSTYSIAGRWLTNHHSLLIQTHPEIFGQPPTSRGVVSGGFSNIAHKPTVYAQGNHLLPVMLAMATVPGGLSAVFSANIVYAGLALLALYGLARRITGSAGLALLATVALSLTVPVVYVARDGFSEPLTMLFLIGGLSLLVRGMATRSLRLCALAGFVGSCSAMVRVDSCVTLLGFVAGATIVTAFAPRSERRRAAWCSVAMVLGGVGPAVLGWLDVAWLSRQYYWALHSSITHVNLLLIGTTVVLAPLSVWVLWRPRVRAFFATARYARRGWVAASAVLVAVFAVLASRPLWYQGRQARDDANIRSMQQGSGLPIDGHRTYMEQTVNWLAMYFGWPTVILGVIGYCLLLRELIVRRRLALAAPLVAGLVLSAVYLYNAQIYPDQPWAMRRYVPIVLPMLFIAAVVGLRWLVNLARGRVRLAVAERGQPWVRRVAGLAAAASAVLLLLTPILVLRPVWTVRQEGGQFPQLDALCHALPANAAVVTTDYSAQISYGQAVRTYCDVPSFGLPDPGQEALASMYQAVQKTGRVLFTLSSGPDTVGYAADSGPQPYSSVVTTRWTTHLNKVPAGPRYDCITIYVSRVSSDGLAHTLIGGPVDKSGPCLTG